MSWLFGKQREVEEIHKDLEPAVLSEVAGALREVAARSMFGSASLVISPGSPKSVRYLASLTQLNDRMHEVQTNPEALRKLHGDLRDVQIEFGDWQRVQTEQIVADFTESVSQVVGLCETSLTSQFDSTERLSGMQERLAAARECNDIVQVRQILKREVEEAQRMIEVQSKATQMVSSEFRTVVDKLEERIKIAEEAAQTDHLTSLGNRAAFQFFAEATLQKVRAGEGPYCVMMLDLDQFKPVNDTYGHDVGDHALNAFAGRLRRVFPRPALVCRVGGDEFVVVMAIDDKTATSRCQRLAQDLSRSPITVKQGETHLTLSLGVSFGVAQIKPSDSVESAYNRADQAMYDLKRNKRAA